MDLIFKLMPVFFILVFVIVLFFWGLMGYAAFTAASDPHAVAAEVGSLAKTFKDSFNEGEK